MSPNGEKSRFDQATQFSSKGSPQNSDGKSRGAKLRQPLAKPAIIDNTTSSRVARIQKPKSPIVRTSNTMPAAMAPNVGLIETLQGVPTSPDHFETAPNNVSDALPKRRIWPFNDFVIALPLEVGASFGVLPGCETRCRVEAKFGPPDQEFHASTYYTLVDYSQRGLRFYYDKENRTVSYSTFSPISPGGAYHGAP